MADFVILTSTNPHTKKDFKIMVKVEWIISMHQTLGGGTMIHLSEDNAVQVHERFSDVCKVIEAKGKIGRVKKTESPLTLVLPEKQECDILSMKLKS
jgi:hypothetical protein